MYQKRDHISTRLRADIKYKLVLKVLTVIYENDKNILPEGV